MNGFQFALAIVIFTPGAAAIADPATHLGAAAPAKSSVPPSQTLVRDRQGGDTMADAFLIPSLPFDDVGTTLGYANDHDEACPYTGSTAPDVVYKLQVAAPLEVEIDLCGSGYDTKVYVYREDFTLVACNDDAYFDDVCGEYVSQIERVALDPAVKYFVVIDGYAEEAGDYVLHLEGFEPCVVTCPAGWPVMESEPPLIDDYVDTWNGGCGTPPYYPMMRPIGDSHGAATICGRSGWYLFNGSHRRDSDWYVYRAGSQGVVELTADAEYATYVFELLPQDCASVGVSQQMAVGPCFEGAMTITGYSYGSDIWVWIGPTVFDAPSGSGNEYDYVLRATGLDAGHTPVTTETTNWGTIKALYQ